MRAIEPSLLSIGIFHAAFCQSHESAARPSETQGSVPRAPSDNRIFAIFIAGGFDEYEKDPPFMDTEEEIAHFREAYKVDLKVGAGA